MAFVLSFSKSNTLSYVQAIACKNNNLHLHFIGPISDHWLCLSLFDVFWIAIFGMQRWQKRNNGY